MKYSRVITAFRGSIWAVREETFISICELMSAWGRGVKFDPDEVASRIDAANAANGYTPRERLEAAFLTSTQAHAMQAASGKRNAAPGSVALIPVTGIISHRMNMMGDISGPGGTSTQKLTGQFRQALEDPNCKAIVLDVDSPGGCVEGVTELATEISNARGKKPITAVCNAMAASAAYWLASAADDVAVTPSGQCGSIGVFMMLQDESEALAKDGIKINLIKAGKYKAEGHPSQPLSDETRAFLQSQVDRVYSMFVKSVAQNRRATQTAVRDGYGQGRCLLAADAVKAGLADRVATLDEVLTKLGVGAPGMTAGRSRTESRSLAFRRRQLALLAAGGDPATPDKSSPDDEEDEDNLCGCSCAACKGCSGAGPARADDEMGCACSCNACQACDYKNDVGASAVLARRRREMALLGMRARGGERPRLASCRRRLALL